MSSISHTATSMTDTPVIIDPLDALVEGSAEGVARIGLAVPTSGPLGLTGPSVMACGVLAAEEVNAAGGVWGRQLQLVPIDAGKAPATVAGEVRQLVDAGALVAMCGYHTSDVHRSVEKITSGRVPYVFTPPHEGGSREPGVVLLGEDPTEQLRPVIDRFGHRRSLHRWALIGNDYIWPWFVHTTAHELFRASGAEVVMQELVPFGSVDTEGLFDRIRRTRTQALLLSLVGRDLATFNRAFRNSSLRESVVRVSGSLEETGLLEAGGDDTGELYGAMRWFASDVGGIEFSERYVKRWGPAAPAIGAYARGCYEGIHALVGDVLRPHARRRTPQTSVRAGVKLARADGLELAVVD
jgi:urea transport system substrate-binding protein